MQFDDLLAGIIVIALVILVTCSLNGFASVRTDPYNVSLSYLQKLDNGTVIKYYETNATMDRMYIHNNPAARNVTYQELIDFILLDPTDQLAYDNDSFVCIDYAVAVHDHAERQNITAGVVTCQINGVLHALNVFNTTDQGIVYIDCTGAGAGEPVHNYDKTASIDGQYKVEPVVDITPYYYVTGKNDTVTDVHVYW